MKSYTDLEQSKKLAEILPIDTADMFWADGERPAVWNNKDVSLDETDTPAWSLAALLDVLPISIDEGRHCLALINSNPNGDIDWLCCYEDDNGNLLMECYADNQVDVCLEMIYELKENDLLQC